MRHLTMGVAVALSGLLMQAGHPWHPATEWFLRLGQNADSVGGAWWIAPAAEKIEGTDAPEFIVNVTIAPGTHSARLRSAATRRIDTARNRVAVLVNGRPTIRQARRCRQDRRPKPRHDMQLDSLNPRNGIIEFRCIGEDKDAGVPGEAFIQAMEIVFMK